MVFVRQDVWKLSALEPWHPHLLWFARAVRWLQDRDGSDFADPRCWRHLAEAHGASIARADWPQGARWNRCEHGSWFFLPWHRIYLHHFEKIVRSAIVELNGPGDWALPYWNYSDGSRTSSRSLPPAFREPSLPSGRDNPLHVMRRDPGINGGGKLTLTAVETSAALGETRFSGSGFVSTFGGGRSTPSHAGGLPGTLENVPHGAVHVEVGGASGWMSAFETAARDPIFWLHHANLDRLWEEWLALDGRSNPSASDWRNERFELGKDDWLTSLAVHEVLDTRSHPLEYRYDRVETVEVTAREAVGSARAPRRATVMGEETPELIGEAPGSVPLRAGQAHATVSVRRPIAARAVSAEVEPRRVYLRLENIRGSQLAAGSYEVHVSAEGGEATSDETKAGIVSLFGVRESSRSDEDHPGSGLTVTLDVTDVADRLMKRTGGALESLHVTFSPVATHQDNPDSDVEVGGVKLFLA